ncbi:MAG: dephospho-CoA kinase [Phycisphaerales bacterium]|nr:dephospho-CoA kinase [Phycisphaerales bacterium]
MAHDPAHPPRPVVIGLAGSVGAGKSTVARLLAERGCVVVDSDAAVRALLATAPVRDELVRWWGDGVLDGAGALDRSAIARVVFADPLQRRRLEAFIHPLLAPGRDRAIAKAGEAGAPAVVLDAPLLFEAGLDAECDAVIVVDAPRTLRLARVRGARGWTEEELARREKSQHPLEDKRRRADYLLDNSGDEADLAESVARVFSKIMEHRPRRGLSTDEGRARP